MKYSELKKMLINGGCYKVSEGANHERWYSPKTGKSFSVSRHNTQDAKSGTLNSILKDAGLK